MRPRSSASTGSPGASAPLCWSVQVGALERQIVGGEGDRQAPAGPAFLEQCRVRHVAIEPAHLELWLEQRHVCGLKSVVRRRIDRSGRMVEQLESVRARNGKADRRVVTGEQETLPVGGHDPTADGVARVGWCPIQERAP